MVTLPTYYGTQRAYQLISGSNGQAATGTPGGTGYTLASGSYGLVLPDISTILLNAAALNDNSVSDETGGGGINLGTVTTDDTFGNKYLSWVEKTKNIIIDNGDAEVVYAVFMRRPVLFCPKMAIKWLKDIEKIRKIEKKISIEELKKKNSVISLGGGAFLNKSIRINAKRLSLSFWLDINIDVNIADWLVGIDLKTAVEFVTVIAL